MLVRLFFMYMPDIKFEDPTTSGSWVSQVPKRVTDSRTDRQAGGWTDPNLCIPPNFSKNALLTRKLSMTLRAHAKVLLLHVWSTIFMTRCNLLNISDVI